jgi:uncharacterized repeat protein (TIGR03803 family)
VTASKNASHRIAKNQLSAWAMFGLTVATLALWPISAKAQYNESILYNFCQAGHCADGHNPGFGTLIFDSQGNLYGTTLYGGTSNGNGVVYKLTPPAGGSGPWTESVIYEFCQLSGCADGAAPYSGVVFDSSGNLYGTTQQGGTSRGDGVIYKLTPPPGGSGPWSETVIHTFCEQSGCPDGSAPVAGLTGDSHGNFYGTVYSGGTGAGVIYELSPSGGSWNYSVLYNFCSLSGCADGEEPYTASLIFDASGNLYGNTGYGGAHGAGTVYELSPSGGGWAESVLYSFCPVSQCRDGESPRGTMVFDPQGNLYGTATAGGANEQGAVFELTPAGGGSWTESVILSFSPSGGIIPEAGLIIDAHGNLYGTTIQGGAPSSAGGVYELSPSGGGHWAETLLWTFCTGSCIDGVAPEAPVIFDTHGNLYGTTSGGGTESAGIIFELLPPTLVPTTTALTTSPNPSNLGQSVTMTATVHAQTGAIPTGNVVFESNGTQIGTVGLNNSGIAVLDYTGLPVGNDSLVAMYQGSATLAPSTSNTVHQVVDRDVSTTAVTSSPNPSTGGQQVVITATVSPAGPPAPSGTVGFTSNGTGISGCAAVVLSSGTAVCTTSALPVGTDAIVATYTGDSNYAGSSGSLTQIVNPVPAALQFVPLTPCRVVDTRNQDGTFGGPPITGNTARSFPLFQSGNPCGIPSDAVAYSLNVTVVPITTLSYLTIWPTGEGQPTVSTLNSLDGRIKANAVIIPAGTSNGSVSVFVTNTTNVVLDINGYFTPSSGSTLAFYPLTPCRVVDTRNPNGPLGGPYLSGGHERDFPVLESNCQLPPSGAAYSLNFTVVPKTPAGVGYLTVWSQGQPQPLVSTLNDPTDTVVANAAVVPAGTSGGVATYASNDTDLVIDVNGYFAPPGSGGLSFYALTPCRVLDTRHVGNGQPFTGELTVNVVDSACGPPATAEGYVFNATVVPTGSLGYLTLWADPENQPVVSTLNALDHAITSNMAVAPNVNGKTDAFASGVTQLILDINGYFAP